MHRRRKSGVDGSIGAGRWGSGVLLWLACASVALSQDCRLAGGMQAESERYVVSFVTRPAAVAVAQHFSVELAVCAKRGQAAPESVRVDGFMPEHNHGMNYRAAVRKLPNGHFVADGMMFHMPGKWDYVFEVKGGGKTDRITHAFMLR
jgi:hypothetical protein